ncbi:MAG: tripartite tricarboxylate transporter substrate binding protein [Xanthobacteraceae bacterium]|nr:tripartite tricarboxylate transporter substrate binding protein [Xanthobacteraceae bacterium]
MSVAGRQTALVRLITAALLAAVPAAALAQDDFPNKPIRIVVPLAPGGTSDLLPRMIGEKLTLRWGQPVIVENRPGGALHLGTEAVARSAPDGYTLLLAPQSPLVLSPHLYRKLGYDPAAFVPVTILARLPYLFVASPKVPVTSVRELTAYAKAYPDKLNFGTPGIGSAQHLAVEWYKILTGVRLTHVPYRGTAPALADLLAGHVQLMFDNAANALPQVREGKLRALAIGAPPRIGELPEVPAMAEFFPSFLASSWFSLVAPPKTPPAVVAKLSAAIGEALRMPDVSKRLQGLGAAPGGDGPERTAAFLREEAERWRKVILDAGIRLD